MPIPRKEALEIIKKSGLRGGGLPAERTKDSDYESYTLYSEELFTSPVPKKEFELAERIGKKYGLKLDRKDFTPGEGATKSQYNQFVYISTSTILGELEKAPEKIAKAVAELEEEFK